MNYGMYLSASGMFTNMYRLDVLANNLANATTHGYKPAFPTTRQRDAAAAEDGLPFLQSDKMLEKLGAGVMLMPNRLSMAQGSIEETARPLDVAVEGEGFLVVSAGKDAGAGAVRFTRDGRMATDAKGQLVLASTGLPVLDRSDRPIVLRPGMATSIDREGQVMQGGAVVAQLQVATVFDPTRLRPVGRGLLGGPAAVMSKRTQASGAVVQGSIEGSAVDSIKTVVEIGRAERAIAANARMVQAHDELMDKAINSLGRLA